MCETLFKFVEKEAGNLRISNELRAKNEQHAVATQSLLEHYKTDIKLSHPLTEYARYILDKGTEQDRFELAKGIQQKLLFKNGDLQLTVS